MVGIGVFFRPEALSDANQGIYNPFMYWVADCAAITRDGFAKFDASLPLITSLPLPLTNLSNAQINVKIFSVNQFVLTNFKKV